MQRLQVAHGKAHEPQIRVYESREAGNMERAADLVDGRTSDAEREVQAPSCKSLQKI